MRNHIKREKIYKKRENIKEKDSKKGRERENVL